ncbi:MAG: DUF3305 domain-containing protein [Pseudomonadota bacterium]
MTERSQSIRIGVVIRRQPGATRWARWVWRAVAVLPGAADADWVEMRRDGEAIEYHAATVPLELHRAETEAYRVALSNEPPVVYAILRPDEDENSDRELSVHLVTASPFEAQDYQDSGEEIVEPLPMPPALVAWISRFVEQHHVDEEFKKRKRRGLDEGPREDGRGDPRIRGVSDIYRSPAGQKARRLH